MKIAENENNSGGVELKASRFASAITFYMHFMFSMWNDAFVQRGPPFCTNMGSLTLSIPLEKIKMIYTYGGGKLSKSPF
jgi:hypothetical protein